VISSLSASYPTKCAAIIILAGAGGGLLGRQMRRASISLGRC
jgi:hypothetical protein